MASALEWQRKMAVLSLHVAVQKAAKALVLNLLT
jgi:hypothetical protein